MELGSLSLLIGVVGLLLALIGFCRQGLHKRASLNAGIPGSDGLYRLGLPLGFEAVVFGIPKCSALSYCIGLSFALRVPDNAKGIRSVSVQVISQRRHLPDSLMLRGKPLSQELNAGIVVETIRTMGTSFTDYSIPILRPGQIQILFASFIFTEDELSGMSGHGDVIKDPSVRIVVKSESDRPWHWRFNVLAERSSCTADLRRLSLKGATVKCLAKRWWRKPVIHFGRTVMTCFPAWLSEEYNPLFAKVLLTQIETMHVSDGVAYELVQLVRDYQPATIGPMIIIE